VPNRFQIRLTRKRNRNRNGSCRLHWALRSRGTILADRLSCDTDLLRNVRRGALEDEFALPGGPPALQVDGAFATRGDVLSRSWHYAAPCSDTSSPDIFSGDEAQ
jgi:hypothetical protein